MRWFARNCDIHVARDNPWTWCIFAIFVVLPICLAIAFILVPLSRPPLIYMKARDWPEVEGTIITSELLRGADRKSDRCKFTVEYNTTTPAMSPYGTEEDAESHTVETFLGDTIRPYPYNADCGNHEGKVMMKYDPIDAGTAYALADLAYWEKMGTVAFVLLGVAVVGAAFDAYLIWCRG